MSQPRAGRARLTETQTHIGKDLYVSLQGFQQVSSNPTVYKPTHRKYQIQFYFTGSTPEARNQADCFRHFLCTGCGIDDSVLYVSLTQRAVFTVFKLLLVFHCLFILVRLVICTINICIQPTFLSSYNSLYCLQYLQGIVYFFLK